MSYNCVKWKGRCTMEAKAETSRVSDAGNASLREWRVSCDINDDWGGWKSRTFQAKAVTGVKILMEEVANGRLGGNFA